MYKAYKRTGETFEKGESFLAEALTFEDIYEQAEKHVCKDISHEGGKDRMYWFSDNEDPNEPYKVRIEKE